MAPKRLHIFTVPNLVTTFRLVLAPLALIAQQWGTPQSLAVCLVLMCLGEVSDFVDGQLARRTGQVSEIGKLFDPFADSIFRILIFLGFMSTGWMPLWMVAIAFVRDAISAYMRLFTGLAGVVLAARFSGKLKAVCQAAAQVFTVGLYMLVAYEVDVPAASISYWLLFISTLVTAFSGIDYVLGALRIVREAKIALD